MGVKIMSWIIGCTLGLTVAVFIPNVIGLILGVVVAIYFASLFQKMSIIEIEGE